MEIDSLGKKLKAQGEPVISFGAGEPDFPTPQFILDAVQEVVDDPKYHKYSAGAGLPELRAAIAEQVNEVQHLAGTAQEIQASQVVVTNGGKQAVFEALAAIINEGDEILLPTPAWLTYDEVINYFGGKTVTVPGNAANSYKVTAQDLTLHATAKTKALIINSPSNPTGAVYTAEELVELGKWALENKVWIISDEIYEYLVYDEFSTWNESATAPHFLEVMPELAEQTIIVNGMAKQAAMTGWRVGWAVAPLKLAAAITNLQSHLTSNVNNLAQYAALVAITSPRTWFEGMHEAFDARRQLIYSLLSDIQRDSGEQVKVNLPKGAFYALADISDFISAEGRTVELGAKGAPKRIAKSANEFAKILLEEEKVAVVPLESFGIENHIRFSYALAEDDIRQGVTRLKQFLLGE
jgi:aspartate/methionine/tyrosine aminotransferase